MYNHIHSLRPYFYSLREIDTNLVLDVKIPLNWIFEEIVNQYKAIKLIVQDKNDKFILLSLITYSSNEGYDILFACANEIVKVNKEEEEKKKLFQQKVRELEALFKNESLDVLKEINLINKNGQENSTGVGMVEEGGGQGLEGIGEPKETNDRRTKKNRQAKNNTVTSETQSETIFLE